MTYLTTCITEQIVDLLKEDPVRPGIPALNRIGNNKDIFSLTDSDNNVLAITCVSYQNDVPTTELDLFQSCNEPSIVVFYTIWSYQTGAGRNLIFDSVNYIKNHKPNIKRFVTLSPKTELAKKFHLKNGAVIFKENNETVNYEYVC